MNRKTHSHSLNEHFDLYTENSAEKSEKNREPLGDHWHKAKRG